MLLSIFLLLPVYTRDRNVKLYESIWLKPRPIFSRRGKWIDIRAVMTGKHWAQCNLMLCGNMEAASLAQSSGDHSFRSQCVPDPQLLSSDYSGYRETSEKALKRGHAQMYPEAPQCSHTPSDVVITKHGGKKAPGKWMLISFVFESFETFQCFWLCHKNRKDAVAAK